MMEEMHMKTKPKNPPSALFVRLGLVQEIGKSRDRKKHRKIDIITFIITIIICEVIEHIGNFGLAERFFSMSTLYFLVLWCITFILIKLILVITVFKGNFYEKE
jgi:hypothetical protein